MCPLKINIYHIKELVRLAMAHLRINKALSLAYSLKQLSVSSVFLFTLRVWFLGNL
jgi:hypothetical protein